jgi:parallel beta-helix repeat protein
MRSFVCLVVITFLCFECKSPTESVSDITLSKVGDKYKLIESFTRNQIAVYKDAGLAIQSAIDMLNEGGTIELLNGEYLTNRTLYMGKGISMKGNGRKTILNIHQTDTSGVGIMAHGLKGISVSDMSIISAAGSKSFAGICYDHCGDCKIENVYAEGFSKYGIWMRNNSFLCHINNCTAAANKRANIYTDSLFWSRAGEYMPNLITNCVTYGGYNGIETNKSIVLNIVGCVVHQPENFGFYIHNVSNSVLISGCRTYQTQNNAVVIENSHEINITGNIFCWSRGKGIVLKGVDWGTITGNNIIDSGSEQYGGFPGVGDSNGVELTHRTRSIQVTGNNIFNWGGQGIMKYAVFEDETCENNSFTSLNLNYFEKGGIVSRGRNSLVKDILSNAKPSLNGNPDGPDPLFVPARLHQFIQER